MLREKGKEKKRSKNEDGHEPVETHLDNTSTLVPSPDDLVPRYHRTSAPAR